MLNRWERWLLARCCAAEYAEVVRDLEEEVARRESEGASGLRIAMWRLRQVVGIALYALRDRGVRRGKRRFYPVLAVRLAVRSVGRSPGVPVAAALTLGLGFGAAAAIYGVYSGFGGPLPSPDGESVLWMRVLNERGREIDLQLEDLEALQSGTSTFAELGGYGADEVNMGFGSKNVVRLQSASFTAEVAGILRVAPFRGRQLSPDDPLGVVISYELWIGYFERDEAVLGEVVRLDGEDHTLVGVMPEGHRFPFHQDIWRVMDADYDNTVSPVARLGEGMSVAGASAEVEPILAAQLAERGVETDGLSVAVLGFTEKRGEGGEKAALATLLALVVALVLVSCSNVSNLLFARALSRVNLLAIHAALGAGPGQVALQLFVESLVIALGGAMVGLALAAAAINYIESTLAGNWGYYWMAVRFDPEVVLFTLALAVLTGVVSGMVPALRLRRTDLNEVLKSDAAGVVGAGRSRWSSVLLNAQVAFSCVALIIAILMAGALLRSQVAEGFRADDVFVASVALDGPSYDDEAQRRVFREALLRAAARDADITLAALSSVTPGLSNSSSPLELAGSAVAEGERRPTTLTVAVTPSYFDIFGVRLLAGRHFRAEEGTFVARVPTQAPVPGPASGDSAADSLAEGVVVVSESFVREHLPSADAVGQRIRLEGLTGDRWLRIIGVVTDLAEYARAEPRELARAYLPFATVEPRSHYILYTGSAGAGVAIRSAISALDPDIAVGGVFEQLGEIRVADVMAYITQIYQTAGLLALFGGIGAALVAVIGLYGALAFEVQRRLSEIGVRMAMGAGRGDVARHMIRAGLWRVAPGLFLGFVLCAGMSPLLGYLLGDMNPHNPAVYLGVYAGYLLVTLAAMMIPARRAARLDPVDVLRRD